MFSGKAWTAKTGLLDQGLMYNLNWGDVKSELVNFEKWDVTTSLLWWECSWIIETQAAPADFCTGFGFGHNRAKLNQSLGLACNTSKTCVVFYYTRTHELTPVSDRPVFAQVYWYGKNVNYMWF